MNTKMNKSSEWVSGWREIVEETVLGANVRKSYHRFPSIYSNFPKALRSR